MNTEPTQKTGVFRAEKTTKGNDDFKVLMVGLIIGIMIMVVSMSSGRLVEHRWYRDVMRLTPFSQVMLLHSHTIENGIVILGSMKKDRCDFDHTVSNPVAYVTGQYNQRHRVTVDTTPDDLRSGVIKTSRAPSEYTELWGPWVIDTSNLETFGEPLVPKKYEVVVYHKDCPTDPRKQVNTFISGNWGNFDTYYMQDVPE